MAGAAGIIGAMADQQADQAPASTMRRRRSARTNTTPEPAPPLLRGRTAPLAPDEVERLLHRGVGLFNEVRYWHAHEAWETLWRAADDRERDFYQGLIQVAAGLLHLQRRNARGARNKLAEGLARLARFEPAHRGLVITELVTRCTLILQDLRGGLTPYLIPPVLRFVETERAKDRGR